MKFKDTMYGDLTGAMYIGDIMLIDMNLTSLEGCPKIIKGNFDCSLNKIESLEYAPKEIHGYFDFSYNKVSNFDGIPEVISGTLYCNDNNIPKYLIEDARMLKYNIKEYK